MRMPADIRISVRIGDQPTRRIELIRQPSGKRYWIRRDGKVSKRMHIGYFDTAQEAHEAYVYKKRMLHEFCTL